MQRNVIVELTGFSMRKIIRDELKYNWQSTTRKGITATGKHRFYLGADVARSYGIEFTAEQLKLAARKLNRVAIFKEDI